MMDGGYGIDDARSLLRDRVSSAPADDSAANPLLALATELREYLRSAIGRPRSSPAKVSLGLAVLDMWRTESAAGARRGDLRGATSVASVASVVAATSALPSDPDGGHEIVAAARARLAGGVDPRTPWSGIWKAADGIGRHTGFRLDVDAARAERLWASLIAFAAGEGRVDLGSAPDAARDALARIDARVRATTPADLGAITAGLGTTGGGYTGGQSALWPPEEMLAGGDVAAAPWAELDPAGPDRADNGARRIRIWFGTNREPLSSDLDSGYSAALADRVHYGVCRLNVPRPEAVAGGPLAFVSAWLRLGSRWGRPSVETYHRFDDRDDFVATLRSELALAGSERTALVYVHGYANSFTDAATAAAQISLAIKHCGPTALFSWASKGRRSAYRHDEGVVDRSRHHLIEFLETLCERAGLEHVDLVVHSLGNRLLLRSLVQWFASAAPASVPLRNVYLGAPDVDQPEFVRDAAVYAAAAAKTTLYGSDSDTALLASRIVHAGVPRAGLMPPVVTTANIDTIETSAVDLSRIRHAYLIDAPTVRADIHDVQGGSHDPALRANLQAAISGLVPDFWRMG